MFSTWQYDIAYGDVKDLTVKAASGKVLCNKLSDIAKNP